MSKQEKNWVLLDNKENVWTEIKDTNGKLIFKYKECIDDFEYHFTNDNGELVSFKVKEKRVVSFNPSLAKKQKAQIQKQIDKAEEISTIKQSSKYDYGDSIKYVNFTSTNKDGEIVEIHASLNQTKIDEDMNFAGYNLLVSSEINKSALDIYNTYHGLCSFINNATKSKVLDIIKIRYCLSNLDNAYLRKKDVENILNAELFFD